MTRTDTIYVNLLNEGVDARRPVRVQHVEGNIYRIVDQPDDKELEQWEFVPGEEVVCDLVQTQHGPVLAAVNRRHLA